MGRRIRPKPTDEEILAFDNVPTEVAGRYIGWSTQAIRAALRMGTAPFGFASQPVGKEWSYHVCPGLLVRYRHGELPAYQVGEVQALVADGVEAILSAKLEGLNKILDGVTSA